MATGALRSGPSLVVFPRFPLSPFTPGGPVGPRGPISPGAPSGPSSPLAPLAPVAPGGPGLPFAQRFPIKPAQTRRFSCFISSRSSLISWRIFQSEARVSCVSCGFVVGEFTGVRVPAGPMKNPSRTRLLAARRYLDSSSLPPFEYPVRVSSESQKFTKADWHEMCGCTARLDGLLVASTDWRTANTDDKGWHGCQLCSEVRAPPPPLATSLVRTAAKPYKSVDHLTERNVLIWLERAFTEGQQLNSLWRGGPKTRSIVSIIAGLSNEWDHSMKKKCTRTRTTL